MLTQIDFFFIVLSYFDYLLTPLIKLAQIKLSLHKRALIRSVCRNRRRLQWALTGRLTGKLWSDPAHKRVESLQLNDESTPIRSSGQESAADCSGSSEAPDHYFGRATNNLNAEIGAYYKLYSRQLEHKLNVYEYMATIATSEDWNRSLLANAIGQDISCRSINDDEAWWNVLLMNKLHQITLNECPTKWVEVTVLGNRFVRLLDWSNCDLLIVSGSSEEDDKFDWDKFLHTLVIPLKQSVAAVAAADLHAQTGPEQGESPSGSALTRPGSTQGSAIPGANGTERGACFQLSRRKTTSTIRSTLGDKIDVNSSGCSDRVSDFTLRDGSESDNVGPTTNSFQSETGYGKSRLVVRHRQADTSIDANKRVTTTSAISSELKSKLEPKSNSEIPGAPWGADNNLTASIIYSGSPLAKTGLISLQTTTTTTTTTSGSSSNNKADEIPKRRRNGAGDGQAPAVATMESTTTTAAATTTTTKVLASCTFKHLTLNEYIRYNARSCFVFQLCQEPAMADKLVPLFVVISNLLNRACLLEPSGFCLRNELICSVQEHSRSLPRPGGTEQVIKNRPSVVRNAERGAVPDADTDVDSKEQAKQVGPSKRGSADEVQSNGQLWHQLVGFNLMECCKIDSSDSHAPASSSSASSLSSWSSLSDNGKRRAAECTSDKSALLSRYTLILMIAAYLNERRKRDGANWQAGNDLASLLEGFLATYAMLDGCGLFAGTTSELASECTTTGCLVSKHHRLMVRAVRHKTAGQWELELVQLSNADSDSGGSGDCLGETANSIKCGRANEAHVSRPGLIVLDPIAQVDVEPDDYSTQPDAATTSACTQADLISDSLGCAWIEMRLLFERLYLKLISSKESDGANTGDICENLLDSLFDMSGQHGRQRRRQYQQKRRNSKGTNVGTQLSSPINSDFEKDAGDFDEVVALNNEPDSVDAKSIQSYRATKDSINLDRNRKAAGGQLATLICSRSKDMKQSGMLRNMVYFLVFLMLRNQLINILEGIQSNLRQNSRDDWIQLKRFIYPEGFDQDEIEDDAISILLRQEQAEHEQEWGEEQIYQMYGQAFSGVEAHEAKADSAGESQTKQTEHESANGPATAEAGSDVKSTEDQAELDQMTMSLFSSILSQALEGADGSGAGGPLSAEELQRLLGSLDEPQGGDADGEEGPDPSEMRELLKLFQEILPKLMSGAQDGGDDQVLSPLLESHGVAEEQSERANQANFDDVTQNNGHDDDDAGDTDNTDDEDDVNHAGAERRVVIEVSNDDVKANIGFSPPLDRYRLHAVELVEKISDSSGHETGQADESDDDQKEPSATPGKPSSAREEKDTKKIQPDALRVEL